MALPAEWTVEMTRLTVFWADPTFSAKFHSIFGIEPDKVEIQNATRVNQEFKQLGESNLMVINAPGRTDVLVVPPTPLVAASSESLTMFDVNATSWLLRVQNSVKRVAVGGVLYMKKPSRVDGYKTLQTFLKSVSINPEKSKEFFYQINWPTASEINPEYLINRISKWSVAELKSAIFSGALVPSAMTPNEIAVRLELDLSTPADLNESLKQEELGRYHQELLAFMGDIKINGEPAC